MAFPVIKIDSTDGAASDSAASGAGPDTALTGSLWTTSSDGLTVTLDGSPDLSGVATDGSAVIYLNDSTAGARNFGRITAVDDGAKTVTVDTAFRTSAAGLGWAIGGVRASLFSASSYKLVKNNTGNGDMNPGWIVEFQDGHSESAGTTSRDFMGAGDTTNGPKIIRATGTATIASTESTGAGAFVPRNKYWRFEGITFDRGNALGPVIASTIATNVQFVGCKIDGGSVSVQLQDNSSVESCEITGFSTAGIQPDQDTRIIGNYIHDGTGKGIDFDGSIAGMIIAWNIIKDVTTIGIDLNQQRADAFASLLLFGNTVYSCGSDGMEITGDNDGQGSTLIANNLLVSNGVYGIDFGGMTANDLAAYGIALINNAFYNNTSGETNPSGLDTAGVSRDHVTLTGDPFTDAANGDFSLNDTAGAGAAARSAGFPGEFPAGLTESFTDIGAAQVEPAAASGGGALLRPVSMSGGLV